MARLKILTGPLRGQTFELEKGGRAKVIGRGTENVDIRIPDKAISRRHAELSFRDGQWALRDLNSSNGTFIDELRIGENMLLKQGDQIRCGSTVLLFEADESHERGTGILPVNHGQSCPEQSRGDGHAARPVELEFDPGETMVAIAFDSLQSKQTVLQRQRMMQAGQTALNLSHGIKNLLQAVRSGQDVMDDAFGQRDIDQAKKAWNILKRNLDKIQKLVLDMLKLSKDQPLRRQPCQFNRLVETVIQMLRPQADQRQVGITLQADEHLGLVSLDPDQIQDVVMNLLLNAIEAVPQQTGQVMVHTELNQNDKMVVLRVSDNGKGIEDTRAIFEPFHSEKPHVGTGLGLSIAKKIVQMHQGAIEVQSLPGEGSIFTARLPIVDEA